MGDVPESPAIAGRPLQFRLFRRRHALVPVDQQLEAWSTRLTARRSWDDAEEITFECEPGTLTRAKLAAIRDIGVTRLSLGVENFDDRDSGVERPRAPVAGDLSRLRARARARLSADQHRPDRRDAGGDRRQLAGVRRSDARAVARQRDHLPDGAAVQHDDQRDLLKGTGGSSRDRSPSWARNGAGSRRRSRRSKRAGYTSAARTPL